MQVAFEWRIGSPPPEGLVSVTVRFSDSEVRALVEATTDGASTPSAGDCRSIARPIALLLQGALADGTLVLGAGQE